VSELYPKPADLPLAQEDWDALPEQVQRIFGAYALVQQARLDAQQDRLEALEERVRELEARLRGVVAPLDLSADLLLVGTPLRDDRDRFGLPKPGHPVEDVDRDGCLCCLRLESPCPQPVPNDALVPEHRVLAPRLLVST